VHAEYQHSETTRCIECSGRLVPVDTHLSLSSSFRCGVHLIGECHTFLHSARYPRNLFRSRDIVIM
jgi:hypothetical protein